MAVKKSKEVETEEVKIEVSKKNKDGFIAGQVVTDEEYSAYLAKKK